MLLCHHHRRRHRQCFRFHPSFSILTKTIASTMRHGGSFLALFGMMLFAIVMGGYITFGHQVFFNPLRYFARRGWKALRRGLGVGGAWSEPRLQVTCVTCVT